MPHYGMFWDVLGSSFVQPFHGTCIILCLEAVSTLGTRSVTYACCKDMVQSAMSRYLLIIENLHNLSRIVM
jgi:hypothetical protein